MCRVYSNILGTLKYNCAIKTSEMFSFPPLIVSPVTTRLSFCLLIKSPIISPKTIILYVFS